MFVYLFDDLILGFCYDSSTGRICTCIDYHPCITNEPTNQVWQSVWLSVISGTIGNLTFLEAVGLILIQHKCVLTTNISSHFYNLFGVRLPHTVFPNSIHGRDYDIPGILFNAIPVLSFYF